MFEVVVANHKKSVWEWQVRDPNGKVIVFGRERTREAARYQGRRALFLLLMTRKHT